MTDCLSYLGINPPVALHLGAGVQWRAVVRGRVQLHHQWHLLRGGRRDGADGSRGPHLVPRSEDQQQRPLLRPQLGVAGEGRDIEESQGLALHPVGGVGGERDTSSDGEGLGGEADGRERDVVVGLQRKI